MAPLLASGDLLLHTAEYEGMPLAILEAMAAGLPCAVSETLHREMPFLDETNSIRLSEDDAGIEVLRDRSELARRAKAAGELAAARFSTEAMAAAYEAPIRGACRVTHSSYSSHSSYYSHRRNRNNRKNGSYPRPTPYNPYSSRSRRVRGRVFSSFSISIFFPRQCLSEMPLSFSPVAVT